jgi:hypothetical protein
MSTIKSSSENLTLNADGAGNDIIFESNGAEKASLTDAGVFTATSFAGSGASLTGLPAHTGNVAFPATQVASADANTLDDYEEGLATMTCSSNSGTLTMNTASDQLSYVKIGRLVFIQGWFTFSTASTPGGTFTISGLPFTCAALSEGADTGHISAFVRNTASTCVGLKFYLSQGTTFLTGREDGRTDDGSNCANYVDTGSALSISGSYYASA